MTVYILLFRGVGGATQLPTKPLREALTKAGFDNVGTYINSGNAYLKTDMPRGEMLKTVAEICEKQFGFTKAIYAPTLAEWKKLVKNNPFEGKFEEGRFLHAAWLREAAGEGKSRRAAGARSEGRGHRGRRQRRLSQHAGWAELVKARHKIRQRPWRAEHRAQLEHGAETARNWPRRPRDWPQAVPNQLAVCCLLHRTNYSFAFPGEFPHMRRHRRLGRVLTGFPDQ